jgi:hypothetical protein
MYTLKSAGKNIQFPKQSRTPWVDVADPQGSADHRLRTAGLDDRNSIPGRDSRLLHQVQTGSVAHPAVEPAVPEFFHRDTVVKNLTTRFQFGSYAFTLCGVRLLYILTLEFLSGWLARRRHVNQSERLVAPGTPFPTYSPYVGIICALYIDY